MLRDFYNSMAGPHWRPSPKFSLRLAQVTLPARRLGSYLLQHNSHFPCCKRWRVKLRRDIKTRLSVYLPVARVQPHLSPFPSSLREGGKGAALHTLSSSGYTFLCFGRYNVLNNECSASGFRLVLL